MTEFHALRITTVLTTDTKLDIRPGLSSLIPGNENAVYRVIDGLVDSFFPILAEFDKLARPMVQRAAVSIRQSQVLAALRDVLLPNLLSGKLPVKEAERAAEAVL